MSRREATPQLWQLETRLESRAVIFIRVYSLRLKYSSRSEIIEILCDDAIGYRGIDKHRHTLSKCVCTSVRHHTIDKLWTKKSTKDAMTQAIADLTRKMLQQDKDRFWYKEGWKKKKNKADGNERVITEY
jgi:hypothetical protein